MTPQTAASLLVLIEGEDGTTIPHKLTVTPRQVEIDANSAREADTFRLELGYEDFPFDPRAVRFIQVAIYGAATRPGDPLPLDRSTLRLMGNVDEPETSLTERGNTVSMRGRDYTSYFLDTKWSGGALDIDQPLDAVVSDFLRRVPGARGMPHWYSRGAAELVLADLVGRSLYTPSREGDDAWTVLSELLGRAGLIPVVVHDALQIVTPADVGMVFRDPVDGGDLPPLHARMTYGWDLERLRFGRDYNDARTHQIRLICWDPERRESTSVLYPEEPIVLSRKIGVDGKAQLQQASILPYYETGSFTEAQLFEKARRIYDQRAREQIQGSFETRSFVDIEGQDLMGLANGHRVTIKLEPDEVMVLETMSPAEGTRYLVERGYAVDVARALMDAKQRANQIAVEYYVRRARHRWHHDEGYSLEVEFVNLVGTGA